MTDTNELISKYTDVEKRQTLRFGGRTRNKNPGKHDYGTNDDGGPNNGKPNTAAKKGRKKPPRRKVTNRRRKMRFGKPSRKHTMRPAMRRTIRKYVEEPVEKANPNHSKTTGQFTSGGSGGGKAPRKATSKTGPKKRAGNPNTARKPTQAGDGPYKGARMTRNTKASTETYNIKHNGVRIGGVYKTMHGTYAGSQDLHRNAHSNLNDPTKGPNIVAFKTKAQAKNFVLTNNNKGGQW